MLQALHAMSMLKDLSGKSVEISSGRLSYEIEAAGADIVPIIGQLVEQRFGFVPVRDPAIGLSEVIAEIEFSGVKLGLGWINWSGAYVMAFCQSGAQYIRKMANFLDDELELPNYRKYVNV